MSRIATRRSCRPIGFVRRKAGDSAELSQTAGTAPVLLSPGTGFSHPACAGVGLWPAKSRTMKVTRRDAFITAAIVAAAALLLSLPLRVDADRANVLLLLCGLAALAGFRPVRIGSLKTHFTATHPFLLCALAVHGGVAAVVVAVAGVAAAIAGTRVRLRPSQVLFNLAEVVVSTCAAYWAFVLAGGTPGAALVGLLWPLTSATIVFFVTNSVLVTCVVALDRNGDPVALWRATFGWSLASYLSGLTLAVALLVVLGRLGPWGLALGLPPVWLLLGFYGAHRERLEEKQRRIVEVECLNAELRSRVVELREALDHVKQLQGLLPICMHCKRIRDGQDTWQLIETYLSEHTDARFTHGLCDACRERHYGDVVART